MTAKKKGAAKKASGEKASEPSESAQAKKNNLVVVGIGASAGGLEALEELFTTMPADTGMAFVVISHQSPGHVSLLPEPAVFESVRTLEPGWISDPIYCTDKVLAQPGVLRGGFAIIRVVERQPERSRSFEEAFDDVRRVWVVQHREEVNEAVIDSILTEGGFRIIRLPTPEELQT